MKTILIVDDSPFIAREITDIVTDHDYEVAGCAKNGEDGIVMARDLKPDIITMDIIMPGIDGIEAAAEILKDNPDQKIVMLSSLCDQDTFEEIQAIGLKHLVAKPIEAEQLLKILDEEFEEG
ncbi:MAG: response regulator [Lachnospiraceae bacterium]|nr:response regulator [Lachnospiraceae bacterium]